MRHITPYLAQGLFLALGIGLQLLAYYLQGDSLLSLCSGILGVCSVVLCSTGNILTFLFGVGQILTYSYLCYAERFYAGIGMNIFYLISQVYGVYAWRKRLNHTDEDNQSTSLRTRKLKPAVIFIGMVIIIASSLLTGYLLATYTDDSQPYLDAFTTVPAIAAQLLMVMAYREQWPLWLLIDIIYVVLWARAGDACMTVQYAFWCTNCIYGYVRWTQLIKEEKAITQQTI